MSYLQETAKACDYLIDRELAREEARSVARAETVRQIRATRESACPYYVIIEPGTSTILGGQYFGNHSVAGQYAAQLSGRVVPVSWYRSHFKADPLHGLTANLEGYRPKAGQKTITDEAARKKYMRAYLARKKEAAL
jgi:hypothetical protein